jgi:hypothetical protein
VSRIRSDFWVSAHLRRCALEGIDAVLRRRGSEEAGSIYISIDRLDGTGYLLGPAPQMLVPDGEVDRLFSVLLADPTPLDIEERMRREIRFDPDLWWIGIDDRQGRSLVEPVGPAP